MIRLKSTCKDSDGLNYKFSCTNISFRLFQIKFLYMDTLCRKYVISDRVFLRYGFYEVEFLFKIPNDPKLLK